MAKKIIVILLIIFVIPLQFGATVVRTSYEKTLKTLLAKLTKHPENTALRAEFKRVLSLHVFGQISSSVKRIQKNSHDVEAYLNAAKAYYMAGHQTEGLEILNDGVSNNPNSVALWMSIGWFELEAKRPLEALSVFREVIRIDDKNAAAHHHIAFLLAQPEESQIFDLTQALQHAKMAVEIDPENLEFASTLAQIHKQLQTMP